MKALALVALVAATPAVGQMQCGGYADAVAHLSSEYGESLTMQGMDGAGNVVAMFANPDTGTWTALIVRPDGTACMAASGGAFEYHKPKPNA
jgi:hypothetical protein